MAEQADYEPPLTPRREAALQAHVEEQAAAIAASAFPEEPMRARAFIVRAIMGRDQIERSKAARDLQSLAEILYGSLPKEENEMKIGGAFPSKYIKHEDLNGKRVLVTMDRVTLEGIGIGNDQEEKPVLHFEGHSKGMVLNKTNAETIVEVTGTDETDLWKGKKIILYKDKTKFGGKTVDCIRVAAPPESKPAVEEPITEGFEASDEDVPF